MAIAHPAVPELDILPVSAVLVSRGKVQRQEERCEMQDARCKVQRRTE